MTWLLLALCLLAAFPATAQPQPPVRQRKDRHASLPSTPSKPMLELYVAADNLTTAAFNAKLDPDSLVVDKTRFKWAEVSEHFLLVQPFADVSEKLIIQVGFLDRALPAKAVIAVTSKADVMDGKVEVNFKEFKAQSAGSVPVSLVFSGWLNKYTVPLRSAHRVLAL